MELFVLLERFLGFHQGICFIRVKASSSPRLLLAEGGPRGATVGCASAAALEGLGGSCARPGVALDKSCCRSVAWSSEGTVKIDEKEEL